MAARFRIRGRLSTTRTDTVVFQSVGVPYSFQSATSLIFPGWLSVIAMKGRIFPDTVCLFPRRTRLLILPPGRARLWIWNFLDDAFDVARYL